MVEGISSHTSAFKTRQNECKKVIKFTYIIPIVGYRVRHVMYWRCYKGCVLKLCWSVWNIFISKWTIFPKADDKKIINKHTGLFRFSDESFVWNLFAVVLKRPESLVKEILKCWYMYLSNVFHMNMKYNIYFELRSFVWCFTTINVSFPRDQYRVWFFL